MRARRPTLIDIRSDGRRCGCYYIMKKPSCVGRNAYCSDNLVPQPHTIDVSTGSALVLRSSIHIASWPVGGPVHDLALLDRLQWSRP